MPAPFDMPGHYWDESAQRFFRLASQGIATPNILDQQELHARRRVREEADARAAVRAEKQRRLRVSGKEKDAPPKKPPIVSSPALRDPFFRSALCGRDDDHHSLGNEAAVAYVQGLRLSTTVYTRESRAVTAMYVDGREEGSSSRMGRLYLPNPSGFNYPVHGFYIDHEFYPEDPSFSLIRSRSTWQNRYPTLSRRYFNLHAPLPQGRPIEPPTDSSLVRATQMTYHAPTDRLLMTSAEWNGREVLATLIPPYLSLEEHDALGAMPPAVMFVGSDDAMQQQQQQPWGRRERAGAGVAAEDGGLHAASCVAAPAAANNLIGAIGTNQGLALIERSCLNNNNNSNDDIYWPTTPQKVNLSPMIINGPAAFDGEAVSIKSVDFFENHPDLLVTAAMSHLWLVDLRESHHHRWHEFYGGGPKSLQLSQPSQPRHHQQHRYRQQRQQHQRHQQSRQHQQHHPPARSNVLHVHSVGGHRVLSAGINNEMLLYDVRIVRRTLPPQSKSKSKKHPSTVDTVPLLRFPHFHNQFDYQNQPLAVSPELGIVAAADFGPAHGRASRIGVGSDLKPTRAPFSSPNWDGGLSLFSLATGQRLQPGTGLHGLSRRNPGSPADPFMDNNDFPIVRSLQFATLPGDRVPSLFVGGMNHVRVFSMHSNLDDQDLDT